MKYFTRFISVILALVFAVTGLTVSAAASSANFKLEGPDYCASGNQAELSLVTEEGLYGVSGVLSYNPIYLSFEEISADISGWSVDYNQESGKILFACSDEKANNPSVKGKSVLTVTFKVNSYPSGNTVTVEASELKASDGKKLSEAADTRFTLSGKKSGNTQVSAEDEYETIYTEGTIADEDNNYLKSLEVKDVTFTPEFTPENKSYEATVPFEIEQVEVIAVPEYEGATVTIDGTELTYVGRNIVKVVVLSESGLKRTYKIYIERTAPDGKTVDSSKASLPVIAIVGICVGGALLLAAVIFIIIVLIRRKKLKGNN